MVIGCSFIRVIGGYSIHGYWWLLIGIILIDIVGYFVIGY